MARSGVSGTQGHLPPKCKADLRHLDKVRYILGKTRERPGGPNQALETFCFTVSEGNRYL